MKIALSKIAETKPDTFKVIAKEFSHFDYYITQWLLIHAYTANGQYFADDAISYLCDVPSRFETGYLENSRWAARKLIEAVTPHCNDNSLLKLENILLNYYTHREKSNAGYKSFGYTQFTLLEGVEPKRRSQKITHRIEQWRRKFSKSPKPPKTMEVVKVGSPIPEKSAQKMTDEQWLKAIAHYNTDEREWTEDISRSGGAIELSRLLENQTQLEKKRFADLLYQFPKDTNTYYFEAILRGIVGDELDVQTILKVCKYCHELPGRPCGRFITNPISSLKNQQLPNELFDIVIWYATEDPDPDKELWRTEASNGNCYYGGDILTNGLNTVRGNAADCMADLIFADKNRGSYFLSSIEKLAQDPLITVRSMAAKVMIALLKYDRNLAVKLFLSLCNTFSFAI